MSKHRCLNNLYYRWEHHLSLLDGLAVQHVHWASEFYRYGHVNERSLHHIRELFAMYAKTLAGKGVYRLLVTKLLREHIKTQRHTKAFIALCLERGKWCKQANHHAAVHQHKKCLTSCTRGTHACALLLTNHLRQAQYAIPEQGHLFQLDHAIATAC